MNEAESDAKQLFQLGNMASVPCVLWCKEVAIPMLDIAEILYKAQSDEILMNSLSDIALPLVRALTWTSRMSNVTQETYQWMNATRMKWANRCSTSPSHEVISFPLTEEVMRERLRTRILDKCGQEIDLLKK
jgi:hypothetical protein